MQALLSRLTLSVKFAILGVIALLLVGLPTALFVMSNNVGIQKKQTELQGLAPSRAVTGVLQAMQQHRSATSAALAAKDKAADGRRLAAAKQVDDASEAVNVQLAALDSQSDIAQAWTRTAADWRTLRDRAAKGDLDDRQNLAAHVALAQQLLAVNGLLLDHYGLSLDGDLDSAQLISTALVAVPALTEDLGKIRARGFTILTKQSASPWDMTAMINFVERAQERGDVQRQSYTKAASANAELAERLQASAATAHEQTDAALKLARTAILDAVSIDASANDFFATLTRAIDANFAFNTAASDYLGQRLKAQAGALQRDALVLLGVLGAVLLISIGLAIAIARSITRPVSRAVSFAKRAAGGDLSGRSRIVGNNETAQLLGALNEMNGGLARLVGDIRASAYSISGAAGEIAMGNTDLSRRTEEQAASLEQTAASMAALTHTVKDNAGKAREASQLARTGSEIAREGGAAVNGLKAAMQDIAQSAHKISEINSVIDTIAFQTNILALNAAVEAARAGEQGKGFAVVASEVRALAQRSATAAKEIKGLIAESVDRVRAGEANVDAAVATVERTASAIGDVTLIMEDIAAAAVEQTSGIEQVNIAISQMDTMTQQNAALVEEASAAALSLAEQAEALRDGVAVFRVGNEIGDQTNDGPSGRISGQRGSGIGHYPEGNADRDLPLSNPSRRASATLPPAVLSA
ncbi:methyl-accepting chemotaxis protein [Alcaligenaceae bacterium C4P045]|nr:methyl-accepting chemotaxis protein [Alcaligenaceae bacterium C4P045]